MGITCVLCTARIIALLRLGFPPLPLPHSPRAPRHGWSRRWWPSHHTHRIASACTLFSPVPGCGCSVPGTIGACHRVCVPRRLACPAVGAPQLLGLFHAPRSHPLPCIPPHSTPLFPPCSSRRCRVCRGCTHTCLSTLSWRPPTSITRWRACGWWWRWMCPPTCCTARYVLECYVCC